ncbi:MAG: cytochrome C biogenesis protein [Alphaproteobacteria bacterium]|nr:MAG: cytochrome C biogenesis protein [Alphaproteobacteria bacterium]
MLACLLIGGAASANPVRTPHVTATLEAEVATVVPGQPFRAGLRLEMKPGWHTYWQNPGDSGLATEIEWLLPPGVTAGAIQWPAPHRYPFGPLVNHGYSGEVLLPVSITVPSTGLGARVRLQAEARWLVCEQICVPEEATLVLDLPVGPIAYAALPETMARFAAADAAQPRPNPWAVTAERAGDRLRVVLAAGLAPGPTPEGHLFALDPQRLQHAAPQRVLRQADGALVVEVRLATQDPSPFEAVLALTQANGGEVRRDALALTVPVPLVTSGGGEGVGLALALLLALAGGVILNLMPCVFPVLSIKALGLAAHSADRASARRHGLAYAAGVALTFALLGGLLGAIQAAGGAIGWGFQFQSPLFVLVMAWVMVAVGFSLLGWLEVGGRIAGVGQSWTQRQGLLGSAATGALAVVVATPCTAPFMGAALGWGLAQPWPVAMLVLQALGLGLSLPYLVISAVPGALRLLPRPGVWMVQVKQALAFPMFASAVWLIWVLARQTGADGVLAALIGVVALGWLSWVRVAGTGDRRWLALVAVLPGLTGLAIALWMTAQPTAPHAAASPSHTRTPWSDAAVASAQAEGRVVFVNATADWCITCLVNERGALAAPAVTDAFTRSGVVTLTADWTRPDSTITALLRRHDRAGVPLYLLYPPHPGATPEVLPQVLTPGTLLEALARVRG